MWPLLMASKRAYDEVTLKARPMRHAMRPLYARELHVRASLRAPDAERDLTSQPSHIMILVCSTNRHDVNIDVTIDAGFKVGLHQRVLQRVFN